MNIALLLQGTAYDGPGGWACICAFVNDLPARQIAIRKIICEGKGSTAAATAAATAATRCCHD